MYNIFETYPYYPYSPIYNLNNMHNACGIYPCDYYFNMPVYNPYYPVTSDTQYLPYTDKINNYSRFDPSYSIKDQGPNPFSINIEEATEQNNNYRTTLWTGKNLQVTLMSIDVNDDIGLEIHPDVDQFLRIEEGTGIVRMGYEKDNLNYEKRVGDDFAIMVPAGTWHNLINTGNRPLKLYSIYAPPHHPHGTVHETKAIAEAHGD
ncbi:cupin domain-containing protein [Clostridium tepidum]|jgi:mannose-6-phosphate isomerase-like protein (cupin superfamily)|uniref:Cupin n=1 Tax=Clostridium tepidum TaxID=1962263 RepID=A0A1S9IE38_9CLOT|nr:cupin domain-containing protein [Clostridium tepidum]MDU6876704.1 cupin domain-containing protein [Clostridium botulinum]OOO63707.1 cupin [Clostridium tepidum]OOO68515.1 cupin [Clostridium tepidum]